MDRLDANRRVTAHGPAVYASTSVGARKPATPAAANDQFLLMRGGSDQMSGLLGFRFNPAALGETPL
jgi:hypothetical protein